MHQTSSESNKIVFQGVRRGIFHSQGVQMPFGSGFQGIMDKTGGANLHGLHKKLLQKK